MKFCGSKVEIVKACPFCSGGYPYICGRTMIASLFKTRKPKRFEMRTRYYDAEKEAFEARVNRSKNVETDVSTRMKLQFRERKRKKSNASRQSSIRIIVIAATLILMAWYIFF